MPSPEWKLCNMRNYALVLFMSEDNHIRIKVICSVIQIQVCKAESIISLHFNIKYIISSIVGRLSWFNVHLLEHTSTYSLCCQAISSRTHQLLWLPKWMSSDQTFYPDPHWTAWHRFPHAKFNRVTSQYEEMRKQGWTPPHTHKMATDITVVIWAVLLLPLTPSALYKPADFQRDTYCITGLYPCHSHDNSVLLSIPIL